MIRAKRATEILFIAAVAVHPAVGPIHAALAAEGEEPTVGAGAAEPHTVDVFAGDVGGLAPVPDAPGAGGTSSVGGGSVRPASTAGEKGPTMVAPPELGVAPDGGRCVIMRSVPGDPTSSQALANQRAIEDMVQMYGRFCPESPMDTPEQPTPGAVAARLWRERVQLPSPEVWIAPGLAITGMPAYLEIGGDRTLEPITFGPAEAAGFTITLHLSSTYDIDWGDGTVMLDETRQGGPYPSGDLRHVYQERADRVEVRVVQEWTARWEATGPVTASGTIADELYTEGVLPLEVDEIQAVVTYRE